MTMFKIEYVKKTKHNIYYRIKCDIENIENMPDALIDVFNVSLDEILILRELASTGVYRVSLPDGDLSIYK